MVSYANQCTHSSILNPNGYSRVELKKGSASIAQNSGPSRWEYRETELGWDGGTPDAVGGEAGVEFEGALLGEGLHSAVDGALVRVHPIRTLLHLLDAGLDEVEGQAAHTDGGSP